MTRRPALCASLIVLCLVAQPAEAKDAQKNQDPVLLTADEIVHDRDLGVVTARGHVEIAQNDRVLVADAVSYNLKQDHISASGHVSLLEPTGEVTFADFFELTGDMKNGTAQQIRLLLTDKSRLAAATARHIDGTRNEMTKVVYSPCKPCKDQPDKAPLWQVKAQQATQDTTTHDVEYKDVWMEMAGVPVLYTPYLSHPDPTVKRRSGVLTPSFGNSNNLGFITRVPYFAVLSPQQDLTLTPALTSGEGPVLAGNHRWRLNSGETETTASLTHDSEDRVRGHIDGKGRFDIDDTWRAGYQVQRVTDKTYTRRYDFMRDGQPWMTTRPYLEGLRGRNYGLVEGFGFQGLRETDNDRTSPIVLPYGAYNYVGDSGSHGAYWTFDTSALATTRQVGSATKRVSAKTAWHQPYTSDTGQVYTFSTSLRGDGYYVTGNPEGNGGAGRALPEASLGWRYPFVRHTTGGSQTIEPIVLATVSPYGMNPKKIPNEDSVDFEFDDTNLFSNDRFTGLDRVETGPRVAYGGQWTYLLPRSGEVNALLGQSLRMHTDAVLGQSGGLQDKFSDYVGRVAVRPVGNLSLVERFRIDKDNYTIRRNDLGATVGSKALNASIDYLRADRADSDFPTREAVRLGLGSAMTRYWSVVAATNFDLADNGGPLTYDTHLIYDDECFTFDTDISVHHTSQKDFQAGHSIMLRLVFKTLGEVPVKAF